jgi:hypothetical protein
MPVRNLIHDALTSAISRDQPRQFSQTPDGGKDILKDSS